MCFQSPLHHLENADLALWPCAIFMNEFFTTYFIVQNPKNKKISAESETHYFIYL